MCKYDVLGVVMANVHSEERGICGYTGQCGWVVRVLNEGGADARVKMRVIKQDLVALKSQ